MIIDFDGSMLDPNIVIAVACLKLNAYKLFPSDPKVREAYFSKNLLKFLNEQKMAETVVDLSSDLIKIPSLTPYGDTKAEEKEKFKEVWREKCSSGFFKKNNE